MIAQERFEVISGVQQLDVEIQRIEKRQNETDDHIVSLLDDLSSITNIVSDQQKTIMRLWRVIIALGSAVLLLAIGSLFHFGGV